MNDIATALGSLLLLISLFVGRVIWAVLKLSILLCILWGALKSMSDTSLPLISDVIRLSKTSTLEFYGAEFFIWISNNWINFAILVIVINTIVINNSIQQLTKTSSYTRIFIATFMNYFNVVNQNPSMEKIQESGMLSILKEGLSDKLLSFIFGVEPRDDALDSKAVRGGVKVNFSDDVKEILENNENKSKGDEDY